MNRINIWTNLLIALALTSASFVMLTILSSFVSLELTVKVLISACVIGYGSYLAWGTPRPGKSLAIAALLAIASCLAILPEASLLFYVLILSSLLWLIRSAFYQVSTLGVVLDGALIAMSLTIALSYFQQSGGILGSLWIFFLLQSLFIYIPANKTQQNNGAPGAFDQAEIQAQQILNSLTS